MILPGVQVQARIEDPDGLENQVPLFKVVFEDYY